jgi:hypothetical protein
MAGCALQASTTDLACAVAGEPAHGLPRWNHHDRPSLFPGGDRQTIPGSVASLILRFRASRIAVGVAAKDRDEMYAFGRGEPGATNRHSRLQWFWRPGWGFLPRPAEAVPEVQFKTPMCSGATTTSRSAPGRHSCTGYARRCRDRQTKIVVAPITEPYDAQAPQAS